MAKPSPLKLLSSQTFSTGVLSLVFGPDDVPSEGGYERPRPPCRRPRGSARERQPVKRGVMTSGCGSAGTAACTS